LNLRRIRARVAEVPLVLRYDLKEGASKMRVLRTMWRYVVTVTRSLLPLWPPAVETRLQQRRPGPEL
jgi:dolichol-phosphate mannosyltransferase